MGYQLLRSSSNWKPLHKLCCLFSSLLMQRQSLNCRAVPQTLRHWGNSIAGSQRATGHQQWLNKARLCASSTRCPPWPAVQTFVIASAHFQNFREYFRELCCKFCLMVTEKRKIRGGKMWRPGCPTVFISEWCCPPFSYPPHFLNLFLDHGTDTA